jgi:hypothetical protein
LALVSPVRPDLVVGIIDPRTDALNTLIDHPLNNRALRSPPARLDLPFMAVVALRWVNANPITPSSVRLPCWSAGHRYRDWKTTGTAW